MRTSETGTFPASMEAEFSRLIGEVRQDNSLRPIHVIVPTHVLGARLLRVVSASSPSINIRFVTFPDLAESVAIADLVASKRIPLPPMADFLAARKAIQSKVRPDGYFGPIKEFPGTPRAVLTTLTDVKKAGMGPGDLRRLMAGNQGTREPGNKGRSRPVQQGLFNEGDVNSGIASAAEPPRNDEESAEPPRNDGISVESRRKLAELVEIYEEVERLKDEASYLDESDTLAIAAEAAKSSKLLDDAAAIYLYGFPELNELERRFFAACAGGRRAYACVPEDVAGYTRPLTEWLGSNGFASDGSGDGGGGRLLRYAGAHAGSARNDRADNGGEGAVGNGGAVGVLARRVFAEELPAQPILAPVQIVSAPGVTQEVEEIARRILAFAERPGASFSDAAVLLRHPEEYERTIRDVFSSAGIPYVFLNGAPFADTLAGRLIRLLLRIRLGDYPRPDTMEFLELAPLRPSLLKEFPEASPADWDRHSREAGIVEGRVHWNRIPDMRRRTQWRIDRESKKPIDERDPAAIEAFRRDLGSLVVFEKTLNVLLKRLEDIPSQGTIAELMGRLLRALLSVAGLPEGDRGVVKTLADIARESVADEVVSLQTFASLVDDLLQQRVTARDVYRTGKVIVSSLSGALGLPFKFVAIPGLVERSFPPPPRQDPVLLDKEREAINGAFGASLKTRERQAVEEQFTFAQAMMAAGMLVLLYPRLDSATGQIKVASHFLLRVAEVLHGRPMDYQSFDKVVERIPVGRLDPGPVRLTEGEWDLATITRAVEASESTRLAGLPGFPAIVRGATAEAARWGERRFTQYDGMLRASVKSPDLMAPTQLETYAMCPFKFFGQKVLGVREIDEPESVETLSALDRGSILHDILEQFMSGLKADGLLPFDPAKKTEYQRRLREAAHAVFRDFEDGGAVGYPFMWVVEQERVLTDLEAFLAGELAEGEGFIPEYFEARFGPVPEWASLKPGSITEPLELSVAGKVLRVGGYIDRIDVHSGGGRARVIDYKSGRNYGEKDNLFRGGKSLQLPLYMLAADAILKTNGPRASAGESQYYYITARGGFKRVVFTRDQFEARDSEFKTILATAADGIGGGVFPQNPDGGENCKFCEFTSVCGHGRVALVDRKIEDPAIGRLVEMWEIE